MKNTIKALCYAEKKYIHILSCPICGASHIHGVTERVKIDGQETFGYRVPHCVNVENKPSEYLLVVVNKIEAIQRAREESEAIENNYRVHIQFDYEPEKLTIF